MDKRQVDTLAGILTGLLAMKRGILKVDSEDFTNMRRAREAVAACSSDIDAYVARFKFDGSWEVSVQVRNRMGAMDLVGDFAGVSMDDRACALLIKRIVTL